MFLLINNVSNQSAVMNLELTWAQVRTLPAPSGERSRVICWSSSQFTQFPYGTELRLCCARSLRISLPLFRAFHPRYFPVRRTRCSRKPPSGWQWRWLRRGAMRRRVGDRGTFLTANSANQWDYFFRWIFRAGARAPLGPAEGVCAVRWWECRRLAANLHTQLQPVSSRKN